MKTTATIQEASSAKPTIQKMLPAYSPAVDLANPTGIRPMTTATTEPSSVTIMMTSPAISDDSPKRIGARVPALATKRPTMHDTIAIVALYGSSSKPVSTGEYARTFCRYCVVTRSIP